MKPSELAAEHYEPPSDDGPEQMRSDLLEGLDLIKRARTLFDYVSDYDMVTALSKRERDAMYRMALKLDEFVDEMEASYGD